MIPCNIDCKLTHSDGLYCLKHFGKIVLTLIGWQRTGCCRKRASLLFCFVCLFVCFLSTWTVFTSQCKMSVHNLMTIIMYHKNKQKTIITVPNSRFCQRWKIQKRWPLGIAHNVYSDSNNMLASVPLFNSLKRGYCSKQDRCGEIRTRENRGVLEISEYR